MSVRVIFILRVDPWYNSSRVQGRFLSIALGFSLEKGCILLPPDIPPEKKSLPPMVDLKKLAPPMLS